MGDGEVLVSISVLLVLRSTRIVLVTSREKLVGSITAHCPSRRPGYSPVCSPRWIRGPIVCCLFSESCTQYG